MSRGDIQALRDGVQVIGEQARVDVECHGRGGVAEHPLDNLDVGSGCHGQARGGVPEVVDPQGAQTQIGLGMFEDAAAEVGVAQHPAAGGGEEELIRAATSDQLSQRAGQESREWYDAALVGLGGAEDDLATDLRGGLVDGETAPFEVNSPDAQSRRLTPPDPGVGENANKGVVWRACMGEPVHLLVGQKHHVGGTHPRQADTLGRVPGEPAVVDRVIEQQGEDSMRLPD